MPQAVFSGLVLIALAIYFESGSTSVVAHQNDTHSCTGTGYGDVDQRRNRNKEVVIDHMDIKCSHR
jgi:hypothetical protein